MALFKINRGANTQRLINPNYSENGENKYIQPKDGYCYFDTSTGLFFIDAENENGEVIRAPINAATATALTESAGSPTQPIYFSNGKPVAITGNIANSITGNAATATALTTSAGSATQPIYFSAGKPVATAYTLNKTVPSNAEFTDDKVKQNITTANGSFPILAANNGTTTTTTGAAYFASGVSIDPSTKSIKATEGSFSGMIRSGNWYQNIVEFGSYATVDEIVIKTNIPFISQDSMIPIYIKGYAYGEGSPIDLTLAFYIYDNKFVSCGCTSTCPWKPTIYLSTYTKDSNKYVAITLNKSIYFLRFSISILDIWPTTYRASYARGWVIESQLKGNNSTIIPQTDIVTVPYKNIANDISGNAATATALTTSAGSSTQPIYFSEGKPVAITGTISNSISGNAATATALTTSAGSATQPVYFSNGKPVAITYTLGKSVPSDAKFTDTVYTHPSYTNRASGLYKITVDNTGHVAGAAAVTGHDIENILGYTPSDNEHTHLYAGSESVGGPANSVKESLSFAVGGVEKGSYNGSVGHKIEINAIDLNISSALRYIGRTNNKPVNETITLVSGSQVTAEPGNVVIWTDGNIEYLFDDDRTWIKLGEASSFSLAPHIHGNISNQGYITNEEGVSLSNRILTSDGTGYIEGGIAFSSNLTNKFLNENGTWQAVNVDNFYHSTGTWSGVDNLTYTAKSYGGAPELKFTLPIGTQNQKGVVGIGNNITLASGIISITRENILTALGAEDVPINITGSAGSLKDSKITLTGDLQGEIIFNGDKEVTAEVNVSNGGGQMLRADLQVGEASNVITIPITITEFINNAEEKMSLLVYQNGLLLNQNENYIIGATNSTIELVGYSCEAEDLFTFIAISNTGYTFEDVGQLHFLPLTGGTLSGLLTLAGDPTDNLHAATKQYTDTAINNLDSAYVKKAGDIMAGVLTVPSALTILPEDTQHEGGEIVLSPATSDFKTGHIDMYDNKIRYHDGATEYFTVDLNTGDATAITLYGAVWNDYAEYRSANSTEPGRCIIEVGDDTLTLATKRMQPGASIISDTFGFAIGKTDEARTPIAVSGRVLAYGYEDREQFSKAIGRPVCSGPDGTVSIMTDEEYQKYGYCAIGTVSAIPDYETWGSGNVPVNGRIWIKVV